jgi:class 3 adenylate cyclase/tetratricopeptide (TPR) repeat protein
MLSRLQTYLPADLADAVQQEGEAAPALWVEVLHKLCSLHHNLSTYQPRSLVLSNPTPGVPRGEILEGTILFADVTGFTPLAERLRQLGEEGAEQLNRMINDLFSAILDPLSRSRGELLIFAGDAVQAYFPATPEAQDAVWAVRAGLRMTRAIAPFDGGPTPLSMSVGLARGRFFAAQVGTAQRMEYVVTGGPIQQAMKAEEPAAPRQVILGPGMESLLAGQFRLTPLADGYHAVVDDLGEHLGDFEVNPMSSQRRLRRRLVFDHEPDQVLRSIASTLDDIDAMAPFFPPNVLRRIVAHQSARQFPGEHRLVAVMFVNLRGFEDLVEALGPERLAQITHWANRYFVEAQETLAGCGGLVTHVDPYQKGFTLLCPFGAPLADEETPHRATAAALRLNERLRTLNQELQADLRETIPDRAAQIRLVHHIGITYGPIYTGQVGWQERREYVVVGDDVNLSARLMNKSAPDQILISGWVYDRVRTAFECQPLEPMKLKGKAKPVTVYAVERRVPASAWLVEARIGPLVGRDAELTRLENALETLEKGQGGVLTLVGETGMGKTRLIAELSQRARYWNITLLAGRCLSYAQGTPYTPWIESLWRWFELDTAADPAERRARVRQALERLGLEKLTLTFWELLGLPQAEDALLVRAPQGPHRPQERRNLYARLQERIAQAPPAQGDMHLTLAWRLAESDPALAADIPSLWEHLGQRTHPDQALLALFRVSAAQDRPLLLLVEDLQWADRVSWDALVQLAQATADAPILLLVTARRGEAADAWLDQTNAEHLSLAGLDLDDIGKLAARLMGRPAGPELASWLHQRTQGNPLFATQLLRALIGAEGLSTDPETGLVTLSKTLPNLPPTVREIMLSRVDQLSEEARTVVKLASVIGDVVPLDLLTHLARQVPAAGAARLTEHLVDLAERSLFTLPPPATEFSFVHTLLREAVYSSLPYVQRRQWHRAIADHLAQGDEQTIQQRLDALAYHYNHSDAPRLGIRYNRLAGDHARASQAWNEALSYYQSAIDTSGRDPELAHERALCYERLGDVYALTRHYVQAASAYEAALVETAHPAHVGGKLGLVCPLLDSAALSSSRGLDEGTERLQKSWDELDWDDSLRAWLAAALGWLALRARPKDLAAVVGSGAAAIGWFQRGQRSAKGMTAALALKEMMAGRVPADYARLVHLALDDDPVQGNRLRISGRPASAGESSPGNPR